MEKKDKTSIIRKIIWLPYYDVKKGPKSFKLWWAMFYYVFLGLLLASSNLFAENFKLNKFNQWLSENGYHQYLSLEQNPLCKDEPKYSQDWYLQNCDKFQGSNNLNIKIKNKELSGTNIAYHSNPNRDTLIYYLWKY